jgi:hypothetical protein
MFVYRSEPCLLPLLMYLRDLLNGRADTKLSPSTAEEPSQRRTTCSPRHPSSHLRQVPFWARVVSPCWSLKNTELEGLTARAAALFCAGAPSQLAVFAGAVSLRQCDRFSQCSALLIPTITSLRTTNHGPARDLLAIKGTWCYQSRATAPTTIWLPRYAAHIERAHTTSARMTLLTLWRAGALKPSPT